MTALIVIDMQRFFASPATPILPNVNRLISTFHHHRSTTTTPYIVVYTQHGHPPSHFTVPISASPSQLVRFWGATHSIHRHSPDWQLLPALLQPGDRDMLVPDKDTYDAFLHTGLEERLKAAGVVRVLVCGVLTNFCCETTARSAFNRGFETLIVSDACGAEDAVLHASSLRALAAGFGEVASTSEVIQRLEKERQ